MDKLISIFEGRYLDDLDAQELLQIAKDTLQENERLRAALNPRLWTREMDNAWHKALPDLYAAFATIQDLPRQLPADAQTQHHKPR